MYLLLIYDISDDRIRTKIANACQDYGLDRIQYSAFEGRLARTHQEELMLKIKRLLGRQTGNIRLMPISLKEWDKRIEIANYDSQDEKFDDWTRSDDDQEMLEEILDHDL